MINPEWAPLLRGNNCVDHIHIFPRGELGGLGMATRLLPVAAANRPVAAGCRARFSRLAPQRAHRADQSSAGVLRNGATRAKGRVVFTTTSRRSIATRTRSSVICRWSKISACRCTRPLRFPLPTGDPILRFDDDEPFVLLHPFARGSRKSLSDLAVEEFCRALAPHRVVLVGPGEARTGGRG